MLKGIDPRLNADVLHALAAMGHGDDVALVDVNFPADAVAAHTHLGEVLRMENLTLGDAAGAVLSVLPLDTFEGAAAARMAAPDDVPEVQREVQAALGGTEMTPLDRFAFYERARDAFAVIRTGERRLYGCVILRKGVIGPDGAPL